jgi:ATP/maltotriose-dependent transcriptional regulator MalT
MSDLLAKLSEREQQVVALVSEGLSNKVVARTLNVSEGTIKSHLHAIYIKLGLQSRYELVVARQRDLAGLLVLCPAIGNLAGWLLTEPTLVADLAGF